ncbi:MAG: YgiQ family radical SAM protein [Sulfuritalea sp.]|nr:YgiQ family radical SAM protein [Sulfuritalea sp.]
MELAHRLARGEKIHEIRDLRGSAFMAPHGWLPGPDWVATASTTVDTPGAVHAHPDPYAAKEVPLGYAMDASASSPQGKSISSVRPEPVDGQHSHANPGSTVPQAHDSPRTVSGQTKQSTTMPTSATVGAGAVALVRVVSRAERLGQKKHARAHTAIRLPSYEEVRDDPVLYAHASRVFHLESNPGNARALIQAHGEGAARRDLWLNPPPISLSTAEMDHVFGLPYARAPHPAYGEARIPAWEMIRFSINIMRGCFGGCTFCSITEHEGRIIQSRSEASILREVEEIRDKTPGFTGVISDLGGPTANMYRMACKDPRIESSCRRLSCVYPGICENLDTDHAPLISLYRKARALPGIKKILIGSGLRYDLAVRSPEYVRELVTHHVGGYLKIAPEHTQEGPLSKMMKPGMGAYERFKQMFDKFSKEAGKEQYLIPYFIAAHPGTTDEDMLELALWLKRHGFRLDQVQTFLPTPLALATAMWHTEKNPLKKVTAESEAVSVVRGGRQRKLHKAFLRWHDPENWPLLREALKAMGRADLIGPGKRHLIPAWQPAGTTTSSALHQPGRIARLKQRPTAESAVPARRSTPSAHPKPARAAPARRHPDVPRHPLSRRKGG